MDECTTYVVCKSRKWNWLQIKLQPNDHQAIRKIDEEIKTFEGIKHQSLVQYFGVEMYRVGSY